MRKNLILAFLVLGIASCKSNSTGPGSSGGPTGTIYYSDAFDVNSFNIGTQRSSICFAGKNPFALPNGHLLNEIFGSDSHAAKQETLVRESSTDGGTMLTKVDVVDWITEVQLRPHESPSGTYINFNYSNAATNAHYGNFVGTILANAADGSVAGSLPGLWDGVWLPDGSLVVAGTTDFLGTVHTDAYPGLWIYDNTLRNAPHQIGTGLTQPMYPSASPDGKRIAFAMNDHLWVINVDGTGLRQLTTGAYQEGFSTWSPDGKWIAVNCLGDFEYGTGQCVYYIPADAAAPVAITRDGANWFRDPSKNTASDLAEGRVNSLGVMSWK